MKNSTYDKYKIFVIISTLILFFITLIAEKTSRYFGIEFIPLIYLIFFIFNKALHNYSRDNKGLLLLNILMYIKYVFAIMIIVVTNDYNEPSFYATTASANSYFMAIIYMIIELISIHFIVFLFGRHFYRKNRETK